MNPRLRLRADADSAPPTREAILEVLRGAPAPMTTEEVVAHFDLTQDQRGPFLKRLAAMERDGQLILNRKGVLLLASKLDLVAGRVQGHRDGFGFLVPDAGGADLFLSPREMQKVMHGDRVLAKRSGVDARGRAEGRIVEVTQRAQLRLVGRLVQERGVWIVVPEDQRIKHDILIGPGELGGATSGQVVSVEITDPPSGHNAPLGRIVEVLGDIDDPGMEIEIAVRKFDVPHVFPEAASRQAAALPATLRTADYRGRVDLRDVPLVTIDGADARDFDDAVYCEPIEGRRSEWRLIVAIADVSHYVQPLDPLDGEAARRSTSVYFPRRVIPMLPEKLSNGLCSINPEVDRLVLVCDAVISARGEVRAYQFYDAVMCSAARLTYDEVWAILSGRDAQAIRRRAALVPHLHHLQDLFKVLLGARQQRGALDFDSTETRMVCNELGRIERIEAATRNDAHRLIEECMLVANVCAADFLRRSKHPGLYRVHEGPTPERLRMLREFLRTVGLSIGGDEAPSPSDYARLSEQIRERPDATLIQTMLLRSMQQAIYTPHNSGHFGLAFDAYTHFTSPIRRYPDLLTHRVIKALIRGQRYDQPALGFLPGLSEGEGLETEAGSPSKGATKGASKGGSKGALKGAARATTKVSPSDASRDGGLSEVVRWEQFGALCSGNERRADDASRDVEGWLKCQFMRERVGEQFAGRITGVAPFGVFVTLNELYVEGLVHVSELGAEYFQFSESSHELRGERTGRRFRLTDELHVQVSRVDLEARRIEFRLVQRPGLREAVASNRPAAAEEAPRSRPKAARAKSEQVKAARQARLASRKGVSGKPATQSRRASASASGKRRRSS